MILRSFSYLDTSTLNDYLASMVGSIIDGPIDETETHRSEKGGKAGYKVIEGNIESETTRERRQHVAIPDAAKFQQLFEIANDQEFLKSLDVFDDETWNEIRRGDLLEIETVIRLPQWFKMMSLMENVSQLIEMMEAIGQSPIKNENERLMLEGISSLASRSENQPIPVLLTSPMTPNYNFSATLQRQFLRVDMSNIEGESTVMAKVLRVVPDGQKIEVFSLLPELSQIPGVKKAQLKKTNQELKKQGLTEILTGPALVLHPLAIYR